MPTQWSEPTIEAAKTVIKSEVKVLELRDDRGRLKVEG
jgi:hypothetical protein